MPYFELRVLCPPRTTAPAVMSRLTASLPHLDPPPVQVEEHLVVTGFRADDLVTGRMIVRQCLHDLLQGEFFELRASPPPDPLPARRRL